MSEELLTIGQEEYVTLVSKSIFLDILMTKGLTELPIFQQAEAEFRKQMKTIFNEEEDEVLSSVGGNSEEQTESREV